MNKYIVSGRIELEVVTHETKLVSIEIEAEDEERAQNLAHSRIKDKYDWGNDWYWIGSPEIKNHGEVPVSTLLWREMVEIGAPMLPGMEL